MDRLGFLISYSLKKKFISKSFIISNVVLFLLVVGICNFDNIVKLFGGDFDETTIVYLDNQANIDNKYIDSTKQIIDSIYGMQDVFAKMEVNKYQGGDYKEFLKQKDNKKAVIVKFSLDENKLVNSEVISNDYINTDAYTVLQTALFQVRQIHAYEVYKIDTKVFELINQSSAFKRTILDEEKNSTDEMLETLMGPLMLIFIMPIFFAILIVVQMIGMEINEEKSSRSMEIIISNVKPAHHFLAKIAAVNIFMILQSLMMVGYGVIGFFSRRLFGGGSGVNLDQVTNQVGSSNPIGQLGVMLEQSQIMDKIGYLIFFGFLFLVLGYLLYGVLTGVLTSVTNTMEDYQRILGPLMVTLLIGFYAAIFGPMFKGAIFIKILAFIPFFSPILAIVLYASSQLTLLEISIIAIINIAFIYLVFHFGMKVYKVAILDYSQKDIWKRLWKNIRASKHA